MAPPFYVSDGTTIGNSNPRLSIRSWASAYCRLHDTIVVVLRDLYTTLLPVFSRKTKYFLDIPTYLILVNLQL